MPLLNLPLELILQTITFLPSEADRQCLRLSCRSLFTIIPSINNPKPSCSSTSSSSSTAKHKFPSYKSTSYLEKYTFHTRLFAPGNIFYPLRHQLGLCSQCLLILDRNQHFPAGGKKLKINGDEVCLDCMMESCSRADSNDGDEYFTCWECGECFPETMQPKGLRPHNEGDGYNVVCARCDYGEDSDDDDNISHDGEDEYQEESADDEDYEDYYEDEEDAEGEVIKEDVEGQEVIDLTSP